jgi:DNA end-binding protein Ku
MSTPINAYRSGFQLNLGLLTVPVNLYAVIPSNKGTERHTLCAKHKTRIRQVYQCPQDGELNPETVKAIEVTKGKYTVVPDDMPIDLPATDGMDIVAVPTKAVQDATIPTDKLYYLEPHKTALKAWEILYRLAHDSKRTLIGQATLRANSQKIYRLTVFNDYLVMQALQFPEHIREAPEAVHVTVEKRLMDEAKRVLNAIEVPWEKFDASDEALRRFRKAAETGEQIVVSDTTDDQGNVVDLMDALKRSVEQTKKTRAAK